MLAVNGHGFIHTTLARTEELQPPRIIVMHVGVDENKRVCLNKATGKVSYQKPKMVDNKVDGDKAWPTFCAYSRSAQRSRCLKPSSFALPCKGEHVPHTRSRDVLLERAAVMHL